jgi:hypothetical protein
MAAQLSARDTSGTQGGLVMRLSSLVVATALCFTLVGCGGGGGSSPATPSTPAPPSAAQFTVTQTGRGLIGLSPASCCSFRIKVPLTVTESAGLGANANYARLSFIRSGVEIERQEIGSTAIIAQLGTNHFAGRSTLSVNLLFDFNSPFNFDTLSLTINFTDDRGNVQTFESNLSPSNFDFTTNIVSYSPAHHR